MFLTYKDFERIVLAFSLIGIIAVYGFSKTISAEQRELQGLNSKDLGDFVEICGIVQDKSISKNGHIFFSVREGSHSVSVVFFEQVAERFGTYGLQNGQEVCINGFVQAYNNKFELIGKSLE